MRTKTWGLVIEFMVWVFFWVCDAESCSRVCTVILVEELENGFLIGSSFVLQILVLLCSFSTADLGVKMGLCLTMSQVSWFMLMEKDPFVIFVELESYDASGWCLCLDYRANSEQLTQKLRLTLMFILHISHEWEECFLYLDKQVKPIIN